MTYNEETEKYGELQPYTQAELDDLKNTTYISLLRFKRLLATTEMGVKEE